MYAKRLVFYFCTQAKGGTNMLQIKKLNLTHKKDLRVILSEFNPVLNKGDKAVIIGEEGNGKSTLMKWIYNPLLIDNYMVDIYQMYIIPFYISL